MAPDPHHSPAVAAKSLKISTVAIARFLDFAPPELRELHLPSWKAPTVPKVPVNEHGKARAIEHDIWLTGQFSSVLAKPVSALKECGAHQTFQRSIRPLHTRHTRAALTLR
jgi:hypothetical protein